MKSFMPTWAVFGAACAGASGAAPRAATATRGPIRGMCTHRNTTGLPRAPAERYRVFIDLTTGVLPMALEEVVNEGFMARYRALLDAEEAAFDELEHAFEDGDRAHFEADLAAWRDAIERKLAYLQRLGV